MGDAQDVRLRGVSVYEDARQQVDPFHRAARVSLRPMEPGAYGSYSCGLVSGVMAAGLAAASPIYEFRWASQSVNALIARVRLSAGCDATAFGASAASAFFAMTRATKFTATDATGSGTNIISGKDCARSTRMPPSQIQQTVAQNIAISATGALSGGTKTLDSSSLASIVASVGLSGAGQTFVTPNNIWDPTEAGKCPLELQQNEGFVIAATVPATGTWRFSVEVEWSELDPARYFG